jgi:hypothetical protein
MIKIFYMILCIINNKHIALTGWENQYAYGYYCKCGAKTLSHYKSGVRELLRKR